LLLYSDPSMSQPSSPAPVFNRKNPCAARLRSAQRLSRDGSPKDTRHYKISLEGSGLHYEPGDSLAVLPQNCPSLVEETLAALALSGSEPVNDLDGRPVSLRDALTTSCAITIPDRKLLAAIAARDASAAPTLEPLLGPDNKDALNAWLYGRDVLDILLAFPDAKFEPQEFVSLNKKVQIRLYSISSSLRAHPDEVHLTVATVRFQSHGRDRKGVASTWLAERITPGATIPCFINHGKGFRLPAPDDDTPIIMCGPGTGIAPFRSFLEERRATSARGKAWLFFGEISAATDFFYEHEWQDFLADGTLTKLTTAFSRDQDRKIYVQHRMLEEAADLWQWLEAGAIFYVCGDASRMAVDVDKALHATIMSAGRRSPEEADAYLAALRDAKRYRRDVY